MSYRVTAYEALQAILSAAGTTLMLCRANIGRIGRSNKEKVEALRRIKRSDRRVGGHAPWS